MRSLSLFATSVLLLAGTNAAQTTHFVSLNNITFAPQDITIEVGDTVQWDWVVGFHNVVSGVGSVPDGIFTSGSPVSPPFTYSLTFDQAFLDANPVPGKVYDYFCVIHVGIGMVGSVTVEIPAGGTSRNAGTNPASLVMVSPPVIGGTFVATQDLSTTGHTLAGLVGYLGQLTFPLAGGQVILANIADPSGELLAQLPQTGPLVTWSLAIPNDPGLCGLGVTIQGVHIGGVQPFALSNAIDLVLGS